MAIETTTAAGGALVKIFGVPVLAGAAASALIFILMWPKTMREALVRLACTIATSSTAGPFLVIALHSWWPSLFESAKAVTVLYGADPALGVLFVSGPVMALAGLPAWWIIGGLVRWFERRKDRDIGELVHDAAEVVKEARGAL